MGIVAKVWNVLGFTRSKRNGKPITQIKLKDGTKDGVTADLASTCGDDSPPLSIDQAITVPASGKGREVVVVFADSVNAGEALPGERRFYARDPDTGLPVVTFWLHNDGSAELYNALGHWTLLTTGEFNINGARITPDGDVISATGVSLNGHPHAVDHSANSAAATEVPTATE